jgi:oligopeptide/dipeptide ABC transporter ATP-binding protein
VSFTVEPGQTLGIVGESGSGKSVATQSLTRLVAGAKITGSAMFDGLDLLHASAREMRQIRGQRIGMIFQDPLSSLHPCYTVGWQIMEMIRAHENVPRRRARQRAIELLDLVRIPNARARIDDFPHQFSGGMRQRVMIAMAMALNPSLLIADEPTTALDVTVQAQVLKVMQDVQQEFGIAIILITHDLGVIADVADEVVVMYAGKVMERARRREIFYHFHHPYTEGLLSSLPARGGTRERLTPIPGNPPSLLGKLEPCPFVPRCPYVFEKCRREVPPLAPAYPDQHHLSACWLDPDRARNRGAQDVRDPAPDIAPVTP